LPDSRWAIDQKLKYIKKEEEVEKQASSFFFLVLSVE
jgi:hypothetical protein